MLGVRMVGLTKYFGRFCAVDHLDLDVVPGEFLAILGPSGCGKTTTLRMLAGLTAPTAGAILFDGSDVIKLPPYDRNIGMVFQDYALFPHMTVNENVAFGLKARGWAKTRINDRVKQMLELVRLPDVGSRLPGQLSGGQQQRVALARALAPSPALLLLDEPLSNLDLKLRQALRVELRQIQRNLGITTIFVTHDQTEALSLADRVAVMRNGRVEQVGTPQEVYDRPRTRFVASFIGDANFFEGRKVSPDLVELKEGLRIRVEDLDGAQRSEVTIAVRPENMRIERFTDDVTAISVNMLHGCVSALTYLGSVVRYHVEWVSGQVVCVDAPAPGGCVFPEGTRVSVTWEPKHSVLLEGD